jgi:hypothetical protein
MRQRGRMLASVDELVEALKGAGLVREAGR